jgi:hypothetical protein
MSVKVSFQRVFFFHLDAEQSLPAVTVALRAIEGHRQKRGAQE